MDYSKVKVPFFNWKAINPKVDAFREKYCDSILPLDIERVIEFKLDINIVPVPGLGKICSEALITSDWLTLYVDKELYEDERKQNRLRFSYAHEIGHLILHSNLYSSFGIKSFSDFYNFFNGIPQDQYSYLETQANKFASLLLIPRNILKSKFDLEFVKLKDLPNIKTFDPGLLKSYLANPLSILFGVSSEAMEIALSELIREE